MQFSYFQCLPSLKNDTAFKLKESTTTVIERGLPYGGRSCEAASAHRAAAELDRTGHFTSGCVKRHLLLGASDVDRHRACSLVQKLPMFCLSVGVFMGTASVGSFSAWAHSWRSATASRRSNASSTQARRRPDGRWRTHEGGRLWRELARGS